MTTETETKIRIGSYTDSLGRRLSIVAVARLEEKAIVSPHKTIDMIDADKGLEFTLGFDIREGRREDSWTHEIPDEAWETLTLAGWTLADVRQLNEIGKRWHLNALRPWCRHQRDAGWDKQPIDPSRPPGAYGKFFPGQRYDSWNMLAWVSQADYFGGLMSRPCPDCGYKYGSAWLYEPLPADVLEFLARVGIELP